MKKLIIAGNWKLNKTISEAVELASGLKEKLKNITDIDIAICPVYTALAKVNDVIKDSNIRLGAQDLFWEENGAFTGEVSGSFLKDAGCQYVIIGHSERRQYFNETNETVKKRIRSALNNDLIPIVCVGEKLEERENEKTFDVIEKQCKEGLEGFSKEEFEKIIIAYEPVWAIGTGKTASPEQAQEVHAFIRKLIKEMYGEELANKLRIQYGGSVKPENSKELMSQNDIDGALVGGASLKADVFSELIKNCL